MGGIVPLVFFILRIIPSTRSAANAIQWIVRFIPSFSFGFGVLNIGNKELFNLVIEGSKTVPGSLSTNVAGSDIIFLAWTGFFYFIMIFVVEKLRQSSKFNKLFTHENNVAYIDK